MEYTLDPNRLINVLEGGVAGAVAFATGGLVAVLIPVELAENARHYKTCVVQVNSIMYSLWSINMESYPFVKDPYEWFRVGRGKTLQFFAIDEEVQQWLNEALLPEYAPYFLVGADSVKEGKYYTEHLFRCEIADFLECWRSGENRFNFWIWSTVLTPDLSLQEGDRMTAIFSINGLVDLQHGNVFQPKKAPDPAHTLYRNNSSIGLVHRVESQKTGEIRVYEGYLKIFEKLRRRIKKSLVYSSILSLDGQETELTDFPLMTEGAVRSHETGIPFFYAPGRRIRQ